MIDSLPTAETLTVEFKADRNEPLKDRDLALAALCLANAQGVTLYLVIEDNGNVTGLHPGRDRRKNLAPGSQLQSIQHIDHPANSPLSLLAAWSDEPAAALPE